MVARRPSPHNATREVARRGEPAPWGWENRSEALVKGLHPGWVGSRNVS